MKKEVKHLVLSRYNEDTSWIEKYSRDDLKIYVYDKGDELKTKQDNVLVIPRNNVGREAETYFYHIVNCYDELPKYIFFSQASPFVHVNNFFESLDEFLELENIDNWFKWYGEEVPNVFNYHGGLDYGSSNYPVVNDHPNPKSTYIRLIFEKCFGGIVENIATYKAGGIFSISSDLLYKYKKESYNNALNFLNFEEQKDFPGHYKSNCIEAHYFEKMYGKIFENV